MTNAVGTRGMPVISVSAMIDLYRSGHSLIDISLRAKLNSRAVRELLVAHGVVMRTRKETLQLNGHKRAPWRRLMPGGT
jgi:hypothetical protein